MIIYFGYLTSPNGTGSFSYISTSNEELFLIKNGIIYKNNLLGHYYILFD